MSAETLQGPGLLFVRSRITPSTPSLLDEPTFLQWYDKEHIPEVVSKSGISNGFRYIDIRKTSPYGDTQNEKPYLACYPMDDLAYTLSDEFKQVKVKSEMLPGSGIVYDLADLDASFLGFLGATHRKEGREDKANYILTSGIRPEKNPGQEKVMAFFEQETTMLSDAKNYIRTLYFKLIYARTNAQSRAFKGLPTTDEPPPEPSTWLAVHQFSGLPDEEVVQSVQSNAEKGLEGVGKMESEVHVWKLDRVHGRGKFFDE